jgi:hypothetical protein
MSLMTMTTIGVLRKTFTMIKLVLTRGRVESILACFADVGDSNLNVTRIKPRFATHGFLQSLLCWGL